MDKRFFFRRVIIIVLDSVGIGEMPDAEDFGDAGSDTLGHVCAHRRLQLPHLAELGLGNIRPLPNVPAAESPGGAFGKMAIASNGKDTTSGHWELAGIRLDKAFPTYPNGFPPEIIGAFEKAIGRRVLGNVPASGTEIIKALGAEHLRTGSPIVYTSADSVFQIAAHEEVVPVEELYKMCQYARSLLVGEHQVGRVIARPFTGPVGQFERTSRRQDYASEPPCPTLLDLITEAGLECIGVGKIAAIFCQRGITRSLKTTSNTEGMAGTMGALREDFSGLLFTNLIDFDMLYGHRNDVDGYGRALEAFDTQLPELRACLKRDDLCMLTADHGCDPSTLSTDHSREYVPILAFGPKVQGGASLGTRGTLADLGQTVAENFGLTLDHGKSFLEELQITQGEV